jgi:hypothetical protein
MFKPFFVKKPATAKFKPRKIQYCPWSERVSRLQGPSLTKAIMLKQSHARRNAKAKMLAIN